ncbi:unnamed protein product [Orchesella dallaii]|uniref:Reverse transcriptase domain-containing protein n=1 Tax=Orchesella dallaii TaxID=48710 RepID=A0ABP1QHU9_9HEXA
MSIRQVPGALSLEAVQARLLDVVGPLSALHASAIKAQVDRELMHPDSVLEVINHALVLLGNASTQATYQRQRAILSKINPSAVGLLSKESQPTDSNDLFGTSVRKAIKDAAEIRKDLGVGMEKPRSYGYRPKQSRFSQPNFRGTRYHPYGNRNRGQPPQRGFQPRSTPNKGAGELISKTKVGGRAMFCASFWRTITNDNWVLNSILGYSLPLIESPPTYLSPAPHIVGVEVSSLLSKGAIEIASHHYFLSQIFLLPKKDGGSWRPIINLKPLNKYLKSEHFKMKSITMLRDILRKGMWMCKLDLKDAYFTIPVKHEHRKFLQFEWGGVTYQFTCLPFGLSSAPFAFTKITKPIVAVLRQEGILLIIYLDDVFVTNTDKDSTKTSIDRAVQLFESAGFIINYERSVLNPVQKLEYLGFVIDSFRYEIGLPTSKRLKIKQFANALLQDKELTPRKLAKFIGMITAVKIAHQTSTLKLRQCQLHLIRSLRQQNWDAVITSSVEVNAELTWWVQNAEVLLPCSIAVEVPVLEIEADASMEGWGAVCNGVETGGVWHLKDKETYTHINQLELYAAFLAVKCFYREGITSIRMKLDSRTAVCYINKMGGTRSRLMNLLALDVWNWCVTKDLWLTAEHIPGTSNNVADWQSRNHVDNSSWKLCKTAFTAIQQLIQCKIDLFADRKKTTSFSATAAGDWTHKRCISMLFQSIGTE